MSDTAIRLPPARRRRGFARLWPLCLLFAGPLNADAPKSVFVEPPGTLPRHITRYGVEMVPLNNGFQLIAGSAGTSVSCPVGQPFSFIETWLAPPHGARLSGLDFVGRDGDIDDQAAFLFRVCQRPIGDPLPAAVSTLLGSVSTSNLMAISQFSLAMDLTSLNEIVDGDQCRYLVRVRLSNQNQPCRPDMELHKLVLHYQLVD